MGELTRRRFLQVGGCSVLVGGAGCVAPARQPDSSGPGLVTEPGWASFRGDRYNTGYAPGVSDVHAEPSVLWTYEAGDDFWGSPVVGDGRVYAGNADHTLYAVEATSGDLAWTFEADHRIEGTPAFADGTVYVGSYDRHVYALDAATGDTEWERATDGLIRSSPTVVDGDVYIGVGCHNLACQFYVDSPGTSGWVYSLDATTGDLNWRIPAGDEVVSTPVVGPDTVYIGSSDDTLYALDRATGRELWRYETDHMIWSSPALGFGTVYVTDWHSKVYAVDAVAGEEVWTYDSFGTYISGSPAIDEETVYFGHTPPNAPPQTTRTNATIFALARESGEERWTYTTDALEIGSSPAITDEMLYIGGHSQVDEGGTGVYALTKDGDFRWFYEVPERGVGTSPAIVDGVLYFGGADDHLYALE